MTEKLSNSRSELAKAVRSFHEDEDGLEAIQVVIIVGIAVVILLLVVVFWEDIKGWFKGETDKFKDKTQDSLQAD